MAYGKRGAERAADAISLYAKDMASYTVPTEEEYSALKEKILKGGKDAKEAADELICRNWRLAVKAAKKYTGCGLSDEDLIQEANIGLCLAARSWDPNRTASFVTYAYLSASRNVYRAVCSNGSAIRIPEGTCRRRAKFEDWAVEFMQETHRAPDVADVMKAFGCRRDTAEAIMGLRQTVGFEDALSGDNPQERLESLCMSGDSGDDFLPALTKEEIKDVLSESMTEHQCEVFSEWATGDYRSCSGLAKKMGLNRSSVRKIIESASKQIRENADLLQALGY